MKRTILTVALLLAATTAFAAPTVKENQGAVAQATLGAKTATAPKNVTGATISDRNTNPDNTYYEDNGFANRGDEVSSIAHSD